MDYANKHVIVTGAVKGIGKATATLFFEKGAKVVLLDVVNDDSGIKNERWLYIQCNVADEAQVQQAVKQATEKFGVIHYLINNAGIQVYGTVTETSLSAWNELININLTSMFLCAKYALPYMQQNQYGVIINVASVQAFISQDKVAAYTTAKSAVIGLTRSIAIDYAPHIRCIAVCPGTIDTPMLRKAAASSANAAAVIQECEDMHLLKRIGKPEEVAALIVFLCGDDAAFITGQAIRIDGGLGIKVEGSKKDEV